MNIHLHVPPGNGKRFLKRKHRHDFRHAWKRSLRQALMEDLDLYLEPANPHTLQYIYW